jgi:hypothetical protein
MKIRFNTAMLLVAALGLISNKAKADTVVYDNGPINGTINAWNISNGFTVTDSFTVAGPVNLTSAKIGLWVFDAPISVDWSVGTSAFGSEIASGTAALSNTDLGTNGYSYSLFDSVFAINGLLTGGTYYFSLQNAVATNEDSVFWDQNNGPSLAFQTSTGQLEDSQAFTLYGKSTNSVPDSSATVALLGGALTGLAFIRRRLMS